MPTPGSLSVACVMLSAAQGGLEQSLDLLGAELPGTLDRRESGGEQQLVGVGVADTAEEAGIG